MNEKQRTFTIRRIKKYRRDLRDNEKEKKSCFNIFLFSVFVTYCSLRVSPESLPFVEKGTEYADFVGDILKVFALAMGMYGVSEILDYIEAIFKGVGLENQIERLEFELALDKEGQEKKHKM